MSVESIYGHRHVNYGDGWIIYRRRFLDGWGWHAYGPGGGTYGSAPSQELARKAARRTRDRQRELSGRTG